MQMTAAQLNEFNEQGFIKLGKVIPDADFEKLRQRTDDVTQGRVEYPGMFFQLDGSTAEYSSVPQGGGFQGPSDNYRKIEGWEKDPIFLAYIQHPLFRDITRKLIGEHISIFRAMFMNKPPHNGTHLPYHQDGGTGWRLTDYDGEKFVTIWTALDKATVENGCVQIVPGSHKLGLLSERGHTISEDHRLQHAPAEKSVYLEAEQGEVFVLHNFLLHRSGINSTDYSRRGFSVCYMDAAIQRVDRPNEVNFPIVFGPGALTVN